MWHVKEENIFNILINLFLWLTDLLYQVSASLDLIISLIFLSGHHSPNSAPHLTLCFKTVCLPFLALYIFIFFSVASVFLPWLWPKPSFQAGLVQPVLLSPLSHSTFLPIPVQHHSWIQLLFPSSQQCCSRCSPSPISPSSSPKNDSLASFLCLAMSPSSLGWIIPDGGSFWNCFVCSHSSISLCRLLMPHKFSSQVFLL